MAWFGVRKCRTCVFGMIWREKTSNIHVLYNLEWENIEFSSMPQFWVLKRQICIIGTIWNEKTSNLHVLHDLEWENDDSARFSMIWSEKTSSQRDIARFGVRKCLSCMNGMIWCEEMPNLRVWHDLERENVEYSCLVKFGVRKHWIFKYATILSVKTSNLNNWHDLEC